MSERYDIAIIGSGPAGISAAITAKVRNKKVILFGNTNVSTKVSKAHEILNYPGIPGVKGENLAELFTEHLAQMDLRVTEEQVLAAYGFGDFFSILTTENHLFEATALIVATGVSFGKPYPGEERFLGQGVSYCATCDAAFYKGKNVAVIGSAPKEEAEAEFLAETCAKVYYIPLYEEETTLSDRISVIRKKPLYIEGNLTGKKLILQGEELLVDGIFILRESVPPSQLIPGIGLDGVHIAVNRKMETSIPGCFACGDITGTPYQYIKAAGEGNVAALSAVAFMTSKKKS